MNEIERIVALVVVLLGGGGIFAWRYAHRNERAKVQNIEVDVDLKQLELINKYMDTISEMSLDINTALVSVSVINRDLAQLKTKFVALKRVAQKLYDAAHNSVQLNDAEMDLLRSGNTGDVYTSMLQLDRKKNEDK